MIFFTLISAIGYNCILHVTSRLSRSVCEFFCIQFEGIVDFFNCFVSVMRIGIAFLDMEDAFDRVLPEIVS